MSTRLDALDFELLVERVSRRVDGQMVGIIEKAFREFECEHDVSGDVQDEVEKVMLNASLNGCDVWRKIVARAFQEMAEDIREMIDERIEEALEGRATK